VFKPNLFWKSSALPGYFYNLKPEPLNVLVLIKDISGRAVAGRRGSDRCDSVSFWGEEEIWLSEEVNSAMTDGVCGQTEAKELSLQSVANYRQSNYSLHSGFLLCFNPPAQKKVANKSRRAQTLRLVNF